ncbi:hypothetical protein COU37_02415 [Candidatus Micrarchaeota archaeon CG10_big_fil_rev_8_21_14_0_10_45_29]|nr:MAG: hypothetical protein COU37_02415 [Candidatus Micrarchaeota archaeon CG10_big_fil_rev_8_21_14_0_10_45_29]
MVCLSFKKGQGATEYLVLLAVVLVVAMVTIALLGFFPGLAGDARMGQSDAYWRGSARPFAITEHAIATDANWAGNMYITVQNNGAEQIRLRNITFMGSGIQGTNLTSIYLSPGEARQFMINFSSDGAIANNVANCTVGSIVEFSVNFTYDNAAGTITGQRQIGEKPLVTRCTIGA